MSPWRGGPRVHPFWSHGKHRWTASTCASWTSHPPPPPTSPGAQLTTSLHMLRRQKLLLSPSHHKTAVIHKYFSHLTDGVALKLPQHLKYSQKGQSLESISSIYQLHEIVTYCFKVLFKWLPEYNERTTHTTRHVKCFLSPLQIFF